MKYALLADIHSNFSALKEVLKEIEKRGVDRILCLGDIVGYGPEPEECIKVVKEVCFAVVLGNHDLACIGKKDTSFFNPYAKEAVEWTKGKLSQESKEYILSLPFLFKIEDFIIVHASLTDLTDEYILSASEASACFECMQEDICFFGHTHIPSIFFQMHERVYGRRLVEGESISVKFDKAILNPGAVGQPRDGMPTASYALYDSEKRIFQILRTPYNIFSTQKKILEEGLPSFLAQRLAAGI